MNKLTIIPIIAILVLLLTVSFASATISWGTDDNIYFALADYNESTGLVNLGSLGSSKNATAYYDASLNVGGDAFEFDGTDDYIGFSDTDYVGSAGSICFWLNSDTSYSTTTSLRPFENNFISVDIQNGLRTRIYDSVFSTYTVTGLNIDTWYHYCMVWGTNLFQVYVDGSFEGEDNTFSPVSHSYTNFISDRNNPWDGEVSDFIYFGKSLTSTEISNLYDEGRNYNPYEVGIQNFTASARNEWSDAIINNFTINISSVGLNQDWRNTTLSVSGGKVINIFFNQYN